MVLSRFYVLCATAVLLGVASASGGYEWDHDDKLVCFKKVEKCCYKYHKCGYEVKKVGAKKKCAKKVCAKKCEKVPHVVKKRYCKKAKVVVKCKPEPYGKPDHGYDVAIGYDHTGHVHDGYDHGGYKKKHCYGYKEKCYYKYVTVYKEYCKHVCYLKHFYIDVYKKYKYAKLCPSLECKQIPVHYPSKPDVKVSKKAIYVSTKGECPKKTGKYIPY